MLVHEQSSTLFRGHHCLQSPSFTDLGFNAGDVVTMQGNAQYRRKRLFSLALADCCAYQF